MVRGTRFGRPVLPLVCSTSAMSSTAGGVAGVRPATPLKLAVPDASTSIRRNAVACSSTRVVCPFRRENQDLRGRVFQIETELVFLVGGVQGSCRSGDRAARNDTIAGRPFGKADATLSPRRTPAAASCSATASTCARNAA